METLRVDIRYRPLRIGWAIRAGDFGAFRQAVRYSYALWGGRFNPIVIVNREEEASRLIDLFRVDVVLPIGVSDEVKNFPKRYPYLINPFFHDSIFMKGGEHSHHYARALDVRNALTHLQDKPEWKSIKEKALRLFTWQPNDPLADVFLTQMGGYPSTDEVGTDYRAILLEVSNGATSEIDPTTPITPDVIEYPGIAYLARHGLIRHHSRASGWDSPGFFVGSAGNLDDLVCHWNLRGCDIPLWFVDYQHFGRYENLIPAWEKAMREIVANYRHEWDRQLTVWTHQEDIAEACRPFGNAKLLRCHVSDANWNTLNVQAPTMHFGQSSVLGVMGNEVGKPKVTFALPQKPLCGDSSFYQQHLVASVSFIGGLYGDEQHTFRAPYLPELNEFYARTMHFQYDKLRVEPDSIGILVNAADHDCFLYALPVGKLMERIFAMVGYDARLSSAGLVARQLIARLGGLHGANVFKLPGVRRLLKTHGPGASFTKRAALQLIASKDPDRADTKFSDFADLYIEPRPSDKKLTADAVFGYLVEKGLFRIGAELKCSSCRMSSWTTLETLNQRVVCDLCGAEYDATRQLADQNEWHYRRSGVLGAEKNAQGAVPVLLTLELFDEAFPFRVAGNMYSLSLELIPKCGTRGIACEIDFVWILPRAYPRRTVIILGECKDQGPVTSEDIASLKRIADAFPRRRIKTFIVLSQITPFSVEQIEHAKILNDEHRRRVILLSARELELGYIQRITKGKTHALVNGNAPEEMADATETIYFAKNDHPH